MRIIRVPPAETEQFTASAEAQPISLLPGVADEAREWIEQHSDDGTSGRISAVSELVTGFASAYGVETLATMHWTATREAGGRSADPAVLADLVGSWNERKDRLFTEVHIGKAIRRLEELGWVGKLNPEFHVRHTSRVERR